MASMKYAKLRPTQSSTSTSDRRKRRWLRFGSSSVSVPVSVSASGSASLSASGSGSTAPSTRSNSASPLSLSKSTFTSGSFVTATPTLASASGSANSSPHKSREDSDLSLSTYSYDTSTQKASKSSSPGRSLAEESVPLKKRSPRSWRLPTPQSLSSLRALASPISRCNDPPESFSVVDTKMSSLSGDDIESKNSNSMNITKSISASTGEKGKEEEEDGDQSKSRLVASCQNGVVDKARSMVDTLTFAHRKVTNDISTSTFSLQSLQSQCHNIVPASGITCSEEQASNATNSEQLSQNEFLVIEQPNNETNESKNELKLSETTKPTNSEAPATKKHSRPVSLALDIVSGLGTMVQRTMKACNGICEEEYDFYEDDDVTMDTIERDRFLDDIDRFDRMNSFDTFGTLNSKETLNTLSTFATDATNETGVSSVVTGISHGAIDDDGNLIPNEIINKLIQKQLRAADQLNDSTATDIAVIERKKRKKKRKTKKRRRKKAVGFEYPPISRIREVPRINSNEKKELFFGSNELDSDPSDDDSSGSEYDSEPEPAANPAPRRFFGGRVQNLKKATSPTATPATTPIAGSVLRKGKYSNPSNLKIIS